MSNVLAHAGAIDVLTDEQRLAAAARTPNVFIEAGPGTGKTTVSAQRFGVQRFAPEHRHDHRAALAVSFTRAATRNLRRRVQRLWGPSALAWPHRIVTLDTVMSDLVHDLLRSGLLRWPGQTSLWPDDRVTLDVHDSWAAFGTGTNYTKTIYLLTVTAGQITVQRAFAPEPKPRVPATEIVPRLLKGICTHQDIRDVLGQALRDPACASRVRHRLATTMRALIVDEVFDANDLDSAIIEAAINAGIAVTLVGDPWQALYVFRGAQPQVVTDLLARNRVRTLPLTRSFRWRDDSQHRLANDLRAGKGVVLPIAGLEGLDVVLAVQWKDLWDLGGGVLPLAFHSFKGSGYEEAAATLLLNHITRSTYDLDAVYLADALTALAINDREAPRQLEPYLQQVMDTLRPGTKAAVNAAYNQLVDAIKVVSPRHLRPAHHAHTNRLAQLQQRLVHPGRPVPGVTTHQAKGGEWNNVGVRLTDSERAALAGGLSVLDETHRKLYVACTRAHQRTVEVPPATSSTPKHSTRGSRPS